MQRQKQTQIPFGNDKQKRNEQLQLQRLNTGVFLHSALRASVEMT
jgi:hypothetical protein